MINFKEDKDLNKVMVEQLEKSIKELENNPLNGQANSVENTNPNYKKELLYVFTKQVVLTNVIGEEDVIQLYIKFSLDEKKKLIINISFHEAEHDFV